jgi:hypothetical protein
MKKMLFVFSATLFFFACNSNPGKTETAESVSHDQHDTSLLTLNNGSKWKADSITNHNVINIKTIVDNFKIKPFPALTEYRLLGNDLSNSLNTMIQQCKMKGADHEALHHWLEPVLNDTKELKNVSDTANGRSIFKALDRQVNSYHIYFE